MKQLTALLFGIVVTISPASAVTWSNGNIVTFQGTDRDYSMITDDLRGSTYGIDANAFGNGPGPFSVADDFMVGSRDVVLRELRVLAFNFMATTPTIDIAFLRIWKNTPDSLTPELVFGDFHTNRLISSQWAVSDRGLPVYREISLTRANNLRRLQELTIGVGSATSETVLKANTNYYFEWGISTTTGLSEGSSYLKIPPLALSNTQHGPSGLVHHHTGVPVDGHLTGDVHWGFAGLTQSTVQNLFASKVDLPFSIDYEEVVPEPTTLAAVATGLIAVKVRRKRHKTDL